MSFRQLPDRPSLEHLKAQAKDLLDAYRAGQETERVDVYLLDKPAISLSDCQLVIAREYGFDSWPKLRAHVEETVGKASRREEAEALVKALLSDSYLSALRELEADTSLATASFACACVTGTAEVVRRALADDPLLVNQAIEPNGWQPLVYVCFSRLMNSAKHRAGLLATAKLLLEAGADPNGYWLQGDMREKCLYGAAGLNGSPELTEMLLDAGADPNDDDESFYHVNELNDPECLRLMLAHGGKIGGLNNAFGRLLDFEKPAFLRTVLEYTPDRSELPPVIQHGIRRGRSTYMLRILIESGVDLNAKGVIGLTPYQVATRMGRVDVMELLQENGADTDLSGADRLVGALVRGEAMDPSQVRPEWIRQLDSERSPQVAIWAANGNDAALDALLDLGADPNATDENGWVALHEASLRGSLSTVQILLRHGADPTIRDQVHNGNAVGFACHGSANNRVSSPESYVAVVETLLDHGAPLPDRAWGSPEVQALLTARGCPPG